MEPNRPLTIIAHCLNSLEYMNEIHIKSEDFLLKSSEYPAQFQLQTYLLDSFITTLTLIPQENMPFVKEFISQVDISFPKPLKNILPIEICIYFPLQFEFFRSNNQIPLKAFINSLSGTSFNISSIPVLTSYNEYFLFKLVKMKEFQSFLATIHDYFAFHLQNKALKKPSLIAKVFGAFQINLQGKSFYYLCMENLLFGVKTSGNPIEMRVYDLKGTEKDRYIIKDRLNRVRLDNNFKIERNGEPFPLRIEDKRLMDSMLERDIEFLKKHQIIDYSLLLIEKNKVGEVKMGIIGYFTREEDKLEEEEGAIEYAYRFKKAMRKYFMEIVHEEDI